VARPGRLRDVLGADPDLAVVFQTIGDDVKVPLEVMPRVFLELLFDQRFDGIIGCDLESLPDASPIRDEETAFCVAGLSDDAPQNSTVVWSADELENDLKHCLVADRTDCAPNDPCSRSGWSIYSFGLEGSSQTGFAAEHRTLQTSRASVPSFQNLRRTNQIGLGLVENGGL
jgi:hypothetical protein